MTIFFKYKKIYKIFFHAVLEYVSGGTVEQYFATDPPTRLADSKRFFRDVVCGLTYCEDSWNISLFFIVFFAVHFNNIVHRFAVCFDFFFFEVVSQGT